MRVAMYYNNNDVRLKDIPKPKIGSKELLIKILASGICGSDVMEWYRIKKAPIVLGHEITGIVAEAGKEIKNYEPDDRVFVSHHVPCNSCRYCLGGYHTSCETLHTTNFYPGGFSEYLRVPQINVDKGTFLLPKEISFEDGTFIEPLACVVRAQRIAGLLSGQNVLILGCGISGFLHLLLARANGAKKIFVSDINESRLRIAKELSADGIINAKEDLVAYLKKITNRLADLVIVCTTALSAFEQALKCVDKGGTIMCFASTPEGVNLSVPINDFWRREVKIMHSYANSPIDAEIAIELLRTKKIEVNKLITDRLSLKDAGLGFKLVASAKESIKVIIEPHKVD